MRRSALLLALILARPAVAQSEPRSELLIGGDVSALRQIEQHGGVFRDAGEPDDALRILRRCGWNCFRLRLFVQPSGENVVVNDLPYTISLARRIKALGAKLLLDFHYSDTWADPGQQTKPAAWSNLDFPQLLVAVRQYTASCIAQLRSANVLPEYVQIGNEIAPGMLWPDGKLYGVGAPEQQWRQFTDLLKAAAAGVGEGAGGRNVRIVIHIHCGGDVGKTQSFFEQLQQHATPYDVIGLSYYPWWHGALEDLRENLQRAAVTFDKDIFVVETAYPHRPFSYPNQGGRADRAMQWPLTPQGQTAFLRDLTRTVQQTPGGHGLGVLWWYPESIPTRGLKIWHGGATALFDQHGQLLPAARAFANENGVIP